MTVLVVGVSAGVMATAQARAASVASDVSTNSAYTEYTAYSGENGGTGFGAWDVSVSAGSNGGDFINAPTNGGFDIYQNGDQVAGGTATSETSAVRPFTGALTSGQQFSFNEYLNYVSTSSNGGPGTLGFSLDDVAGNPLLTLEVTGYNPYTLTDATGTTTTDLSYNLGSTDTFDFVLNNALTGAYTLTVTGNVNSTLNSTAVFNGSVSTLTGGVAELNVFNINGGGSSDVQFDSLGITNVSVPEPTAGLLGVVGIAGLVRRRRR